MASKKTIGRFEIMHLLGRGGMAEVYLADDPQMDRKVAIKLLPQHFLHDPQFKARFEREAKVLAKLHHPNVVPIYEFGYHGEQPYMVGPYMPGGSLEDHLKKKRKLPLSNALAILQPICAALEDVHKKGIVHRDLKPANILFDDKGRVYVADFGIAKLLEGGSGLSGSAIIGTPQYMSPEQFEETKLDGRSDQYSMGIMLYQMLGGELPFKAKTFSAIMRQHLTQPPPSIRTLRKDLSEAFAQVLERSLSKDPKQRYPHISAFFNALQESAQAKTPPVREPKKPGASKPAPKTVRLKETRTGSKLPSWASYIGLGLLLALVVWGLIQLSPALSLQRASSTAPATVAQQSTGASVNAQGAISTQTPALTATTGNSAATSLTLLRSLTTEGSAVIYIALTPDGELVASNEGEAVSIWRTSNGQLLRKLTIANSSDSGMGVVAFSLDGQFLAGTDDRFVYVWRVSDGEVVQKLEVVHTFGVQSLAFSPNGKLLASAAGNGTVRIWDATTGQLLDSFPTEDAASLIFSSNSEFLIVGGSVENPDDPDSDQGAVHFWNVEESRLTRTVTQTSIERIEQVAFNSADQLLATGTAPPNRKTVVIWNTTNNQLHTLPANPESVFVFAFSTDAALLASGDFGGALQIWRTGNAALLLTLNAHGRNIEDITFGSDGKLLVTVGQDNRINIWQINSGG